MSDFETEMTAIATAQRLFTTYLSRAVENGPYTTENFDWLQRVIRDDIRRYNPSRQSPGWLSATKGDAIAAGKARRVLGV